MWAIIQLVYRYIILGVATALSLITNTPVPEFEPIPPPQPIEYHSPVTSLDFLFEKTDHQPVEIKPNTSLVPEIKKEIPKIQTKPEVVVPKKPEIKIEPKVESKPEIKVETKPAIGITNDDVVVNIFCVETLGNLTRSTTGSGVLISSNGLILTNAHVAVDLMRDNNICNARTGSPAKNSYRVNLIYIPDEWLSDNKDYINAGIVKSTTGEHDFALIKAIGNGFSYLKLDTGNLTVGDKIETVGYPAERVGIFTSLTKLYRVKDESEVTKIYSFGETLSDVFSTGRVSNAEQGSSGGAIIRDGKLVGIIANVNNGTINALSVGYIQKYFERDTKEKLNNLLK